MANSDRSAVFILQLLLLAGPTWAAPPSNTAVPPVAAFPVDPAPKAASPADEPPPSVPLPEAPPPPPHALSSPSLEVPPAPPPPRAPSSDDDEPPRNEPRYDDYRYQLVASDVVALGLVVAAGVWSEGPGEILALTSLGVYALGAPAVHFAHLQPMRGLASLGMRVGFPTVGGLVGLALASPTCAAAPGDSWACVGAIAIFGGLGVIGGGLTAIIIDDGFLGKVQFDEPTSEPALRGGYSVRAALVPLVDPHRKTFGASLVGTF